MLLLFRFGKSELWDELRSALGVWFFKESWEKDPRNSAVAGESSQRVGHSVEFYDPLRDGTCGAASFQKSADWPSRLQAALKEFVAGDDGGTSSTGSVCLTGSSRSE